MSQHPFGGSEAVFHLVLGTFILDKSLNSKKKIWLAGGFIQGHRQPIEVVFSDLLTIYASRKLLTPAKFIKGIVESPRLDFFDSVTENRIAWLLLWDLLSYLGNLYWFLAILHFEHVCSDLSHTLQLVLTTESFCVSISRILTTAISLGLALFRYILCILFFTGIAHVDFRQSWNVLRPK